MDQLLIPVEYREDESRASPGRLVGQLVIYEKRAKDRPEVFTRGALAWPTTGITLNLQHDRKSLLARTVPFVEGDEVRIDAKMPNTSLGRDAIELVRTGTATGLSIEFQSRSEGRRGGLREIRSAFIARAALVDDPSHDTTVEVRQEDLQRVLMMARLWL